MAISRVQLRLWLLIYTILEAPLLQKIHAAVKVRGYPAWMQIPNAYAKIQRHQIYPDPTFLLKGLSLRLARHLTHLLHAPPFAFVPLTQVP